MKCEAVHIFNPRAVGSVSIASKYGEAEAQRRWSVRSSHDALPSGDFDSDIAIKTRALSHLEPHCQPPPPSHPRGASTREEERSERDPKVRFGSVPTYGSLSIHFF